MPNNLLPEFICRLKALEEQMSQHLLESVTVHTKIGKVETNISWIKWFIMGIAGGIGGLLVAIVILLLKK